MKTTLLSIFLASVCGTALGQDYTVINPDREYLYETEALINRLVDEHRYEFDNSYIDFKVDSIAINASYTSYYF